MYKTRAILFRLTERYCLEYEEGIHNRQQGFFLGVHD